MQTKLVVLQCHTSGEIQKIVSEGIEKTAHPMKAAEDLMANLDNAESDNLSK